MTDYRPTLTLAQLDPLDGYDPNANWHERLGLLGALDDHDGAGVLVGVIGGGAELGHPQFRAQYRTNADSDHAGGDGTPGFSGSPGEFTSTPILGLVAAPRDGVGVSGGAPGAEVTLRRIDLRDEKYATHVRRAYETALEVGEDVAVAGYEFYGLMEDAPSDRALAPAFAAMADYATAGRGGLGGVIVAGAGSSVNGAGLANLHHTQNSVYSIAVGAVAADGAQDGDTATGDNLLVSAYGGFVPVADDQGGNALSETPGLLGGQVASVVALMLEANPNLGARDVQEILALSAASVAGGGGAPAPAPEVERVVRQGGAGYDKIETNAENEEIRGGGGPNEYMYRAGSYGDDLLIADSADPDFLWLKNHLRGETTLTRVGDDLRITVDAGVITIQGQFDGDARTGVDSITFQDNQRIQRADLLAAIDGTEEPPSSAPAPEVERVVRQGGAGYDKIETNAENEEIRGGGGTNEYMYRAGSYGDDLLIADSADPDFLWLKNHLRGETTLIRVGDDLRITVDAGVITIQGQFDGDARTGVDSITFQDNQRIQRADLLAAIDGTEEPPSSGGGGAFVANGGRYWNGGGATFDPQFGFGVVDARAAVQLAETWLGPNAQDEAMTFDNVATSGATFGQWGLANGGTRFSNRWQDATIDVDTATLDIRIQHEDWRDLEIELISAQGTSVELFDGSEIDWSDPDAPTPSGLFDWTFTSNRFWGEEGRGRWRVHVTDDSADQDFGSLLGWTLTLRGDRPGDRRYVFTDEFSELVSGRQSIEAFGANATDTLDASAVTSASRIEINPGSLSSIDGVDVTAVGGSRIERALGGDGGDTIRGNYLDNWLHGGRGDDIIFGQRGTNVIEGGGGRDNLVGGAGQDFFTFSDIVNDGWDRVNGFQDNVDKIDLRPSLTGVTPIGGDWSNHIKLVQAGPNVNLFVDFDGDADGFFSDDVLAALVRNVEVADLTIGQDILVA